MKCIQMSFKKSFVCLLATEQQAAAFDLPLCSFDLVAVSNQPSQIWLFQTDIALQLYTLKWTLFN